MLLGDVIQVRRGGAAALSCPHPQPQGDTGQLEAPPTCTPCPTGDLGVAKLLATQPVASGPMSVAVGPSTPLVPRFQLLSVHFWTLQWSGAAFQVGISMRRT